MRPTTQATSPDPLSQCRQDIDRIDGVLVALLRERAPGQVETGEFGAMMDVDLVNDGPVTLFLEV